MVSHITTTNGIPIHSDIYKAIEPLFFSVTLMFWCLFCS